MSTTRIRAHVTVEITIEADSVWSEDTRISQIKKQAMDDFNHKIQCINSPSAQGGVNRKGYGIVVSGTPKVQYIIVENED